MDLFPVGSRVTIEHAKPWTRTIRMVGTVASFADGMLTVERRFSAGGRYDSLGERKLAGDHGTIEVAEGAWVIRRTYIRANGHCFGELYNVQTPAEFEPGIVRYIDLEVDVMRLPDGRVEVVDEEDLAVVVRAGAISPELADRALEVAHRLAGILHAGGDWRLADAQLRVPLRSASPDER